MQIYIRIPGHDSSSCLTGCPVYSLARTTTTTNLPCLSLSLSLFPVITIRDHKWNLSPLFPRNNGTITVRHKRGEGDTAPMLSSTWTYICIFSAWGQVFFDSHPRAPLYPSPREEERKGEIHWQRSCDRIPVHPVSRAGTIRPATRTREASFCLGWEIKPRETDSRKDGYNGL